MTTQLTSPKASQRAVTASNRLQSPLSPLFSNDDKLERAQARAARAAAIRRKPVDARATGISNDDVDQFLGEDQILELYKNCIKLASENKINQKNTWELNLIDHLNEIIKVEDENDTETNFQKASCTLEAGVRIYSLRVDSVHSEAYKVLGGFNRVGQDNEDAGPEDANVNNGQEQGLSKKETKISPLSTLESSFEALNVKKFDAAFAVDPLYHQTSAQFDEGGAKGLLLNNLGVFGGCRVLFDSMEVPGKAALCANQNINSANIDLSFTREYVEKLAANIQKEVELTPTLKEIIDQFDEDNRRPLDNYSSIGRSTEESNVTSSVEDEVNFGGPAFEDGGNWAIDPDDQTSVVDEETYAGPSFISFHEDKELYCASEQVDDRFEQVDDYLFLSLGFKLKQNAWAGPEHWKFRKAKDDIPATEDGSSMATKRPRSKKQPEPDIDFSKGLQEEIPDIFAPPKNPKSLLLPANRAPCSITLPEDCHYQPEDLVKLFLLPDVMCLGKKERKPSEESSEQCDDYGHMPSWNDGDVSGDHFDDENVQSLMDDADTLVSQPRQVNKIEVKYDKTSKQVDVHVLKESLWRVIQKPPQMCDQGEEETISFKGVLANFPTDTRAAAVEDISPHLCFICLLHLANEHGFRINGCVDLDDLNICFPSKY